MKSFVVGFMFNSSIDTVVLIEKKKPEWMKGLLNGVGGSIEEKETPIEAMVREFKEETDVDTLPTHWTCFCEAIDKENDIHLFLFRCIDYVDSMYKKVKTMESERIGIFEVASLIRNFVDYSIKPVCVPNLFTFLPLAMNQDFKKTKIICHLKGVNK